MQDDRTLILQQQDGTKVECEIVFTYHDNDFKKDYVVFKVKATGELSAATYNPNDGQQGELGPITSDEEWKMLEEVLNDYYDQMQSKGSSGCQCGGECGDSCGGCSGCSGCSGCDEEDGE